MEIIPQRVLFPFWWTLGAFLLGLLDSLYSYEFKGQALIDYAGKLNFEQLETLSH